MGVTSSNTKHTSSQLKSNVYCTPPKRSQGSTQTRLVQIQCDPRSPTGKNDRNMNLFQEKVYKFCES